MNITWPFAQLKVTPSRLVLEAGFLGTYIFGPEQVTKIEPYGLIPFLGTKIRIHHRATGYPAKIIFWYLCANPGPIADTLKEYGYGR